MNRAYPKLILKKYLACIFLLVFLYPFVVKEVHDIVHRNDFHFHSGSSKTFHNPEHHCAVCNYEIQYTESLPAQPVVSTIFTFCGKLVHPYAKVLYVSSKNSILLRGPPTFLFI
ncbi:MAG: hypothetical protein Q8862_04625 [Bacteroidota bacterium]|nr:hypothetical protein [Bacteroidota bacterium]MDP4206486.1 hypothetical protein [Bacteroidota bacterium]